MQTRIVILLVGLVIAAGAVARADRQEQVPLRQSFSDFPMSFAGWRGIQQEPFDDNVLAVLGVDDYLTRAYLRAEGGVGLYIGYWESQKQGDTIHSPQNCLPGAGWAPVSRAGLTIPDPRATPGNLTVNRFVIQKGLDRQLVLYWYQSHGRIVASEYWGKIFLVTDAVRLNRSDGAVVRVMAPIHGDTSEAEMNAERLGVDFVKAILPLLEKFLPA
jgi:EpsI family protein